MSLNLGPLAAKGRAFSAARPWSNEELDVLVKLNTERGLTFVEAADYIRNGVLSVEDYDKAVKAGLKVQSLDTIHADAVAAVQSQTKEKLGGKKKK